MKNNKNMPHKINQKYLNNYSLWYLEHYYCSSNKLRSKLKEKIIKSADFYNQDYNQFLHLIDETITKLEKNNFLNDHNLTYSLIRNYIKKGKSPKYILLKLNEKQLPNYYEILNNIKQNYPDLELTCASYYIKNKSLGPFLIKKITLDKQISKMINQGYSYNLIKNILQYDSSTIEKYIIEPDLFL